MTMKRATTDRVSEREIVIQRSFSASPTTLFDAWTQPDLVKRWWAPASRGVRMVECEADLRAGGAYRYVLEQGKDRRFAFAGHYVELSRPSRLVYTQRFEPVLGHPMPGEAEVTVSFEERDGTTLLVAREVYPSKEVLDGVLASGMEEGMQETWTQLDALLASNT